MFVHSKVYDCLWIFTFLNFRVFWLRFSVMDSLNFSIWVLLICDPYIPTVFPLENVYSIKTWLYWGWLRFNIMNTYHNLNEGKWNLTAENCPSFSWMLWTISPLVNVIRLLLFELKICLMIYFEQIHLCENVKSLPS